MKFAAKSGGVNLALLVVVYFIGVIVGGFKDKKIPDNKKHGINSLINNSILYIGKLQGLSIDESNEMGIMKNNLTTIIGLVVVVLVLLSILYVGLSFLSGVMEGMEHDEEE